MLGVSTPSPKLHADFEHPMYIGETGRILCKTYGFEIR
jgi:hypothetical protein